VHSAAVLDDATLLRLDGARLRRAMAPKTAGTWNLHVATKALSLDVFVLFSSIAAMLGAPGQGNYAAGTAFLDAVAHHRRALGLPAIAIAWGPWGEVGLAAASENRAERVAARGIATIAPEVGLRAFERLLSPSSRAHVGVVELYLRHWVEFYPAAAKSPFLARLRDGATASTAASAESVALRKSLLEAAPAQRLAQLESLLREQIGRVLRVAPARVHKTKPFSTMGLDSLMGLEVRNRIEASLGVSLPAIVIYAHPSVSALAAHLASKIADDVATPVETPPVDVATQGASVVADVTAVTQIAAAIHQMSEDEAEAALLAQLASFTARAPS
jgi:hypothetical protein